MLVVGRGPRGARRALGHTWRADLLGGDPGLGLSPGSHERPQRKGPQSPPANPPEEAGWGSSSWAWPQASKSSGSPVGGVGGGALSPPPIAPELCCVGAQGRCRASDARLGWGARPAVAQAGVSKPQQVTGSFLTHGVGGTRPKTQVRCALCPGNPQLGLSWA